MLEKVKKIIAEQLSIPADNLTENSVLKELGADSLDIVDVIMSIEDEFGVTVEDDAALNIKTIGDIVDYLKNLK